MSRTRGRRRPPNSGAAEATYISSDYILRAGPDVTQSIIDTIALNNTLVPAMDAYWMLYEKTPWVGSCVDTIANAVSADSYDAKAKKNNPDGDLSTPASQELVAAIDDFFDIAFVDHTTMRLALFILSVDMKVFGKGYWRKHRLGSKLIGLERYDPRIVIPKPTPDRKKIDCFLIRDNAPIMTDASGNQLPALPPASLQDLEKVAPDDMIFFRIGGADQLLGMPSPLEKLDHTLGIDLAIRKFRQRFFENGAVNGKILSSKSANRDQARAVENMIKNSKRGADNAFGTWILLGDWSVEDKGNPSGQADFDFVKGSGINREEVCAVYGVPVSMLTYSSNALGQSGKQEDKATFQSNTVLPLEEAIYEILTKELLVKEFGITSVELVPKRRATLRFDMFGAASEGIQIGMTANESRELVGLPRIDDPQLDVPLFISARGTGIVSEELSSQTQTPPAPNESDEIDENNDAINAGGGGQSGAKGKFLRPY